MISLKICDWNFRSLNYFSIFAIVIIHLLPVSKSDCEILNPSNTSNIEKENQLLRLLKPLTGMTFEVKDVVEPTKYTYKVRICDKIKGNKQNVGAWQYEGNISVSLGRVDEVDIMGGTGWILLTYYGGEEYNSHCNKTDRVTKIMIICNRDVLASDFQILEERNTKERSCYYLFELESRVSCPPLEHRLSSGSVFCILFFTAVSAYLLIGFFYKRIVVGAKGLEQIPNYSFWRDFGNLQADGCDYFCRCGPRQESQAYRGIDDHLKMDEERDDQLLNM